MRLDPNYIGSVASESLKVCLVTCSYQMLKELNVYMWYISLLALRIAKYTKKLLICQSLDSPKPL